MAKSASNTKMTCRQVQAQLQIPDRRPQSKAFHAHLKRCPACMRHYASLQAALTVFGTRVNVPTPKAVRQYIKRQLLPPP